MKLKLKLGGSETELSGWNLFFFALAGFGLLAPGPAAGLLRTIETRLRGAGTTAASWFFDPRPNPAGGPPQPSRWDNFVVGFHQVRVTLFWLYLLEMVGVFILYTLLPFIPYFGGGMVCVLFTAMALTPYVIFFFFGGEFVLPGLEALGQLMPAQIRAQAGGAVQALKLGLIRIMIPISVLYLLLGIMAIFLSPPILTNPGIQWMARPLVFALFVLAGALFLLGRNFFKPFSVLIIVGTSVVVVGSHSWWAAPDEREKALDTANAEKLSEEAGLIPSVNFRKTYQPMSFWREIAVSPTRLLVFETLPPGVVLEVDEKLDRLPAGSQLTVRTVRPAPFWRRDLSAGTTALETLPAGTELGIMVVNPAMSPPLVGPAIQVQLRDNDTTGYVAQIDTDYGVMHLPAPIVGVWTRHGQIVHGYVSVYDIDHRTDPWEDRPADPPWWRGMWGYVSGHRPPDPVPTRPYSSPPGTGTRASGVSGATAMRGAVSFPLTLQVRGGGSYTVMADGIAHPLSPVLNPPLLGGMTKFEDPTGVDPSRITLGWILANGDPKSFVPAVRRGPDLTLYGSGTAAQMQGWVVGALIK